VVLDTLEPAERLAFVLHDVFGMTFDEIAPIVDRSSHCGTSTRKPSATSRRRRLSRGRAGRQLRSAARRPGSGDRTAG
jgi:RNA polymerase sigma-70 factor, ECF subfamily